MEKAKKANCDSCTLSSNPFVPSEYNKGATLAALAEAPGLVEVNLGRPLVGPAGQELNSIIMEVGAKRGQFNFFNACDCRPIEGNKNRTPRFDEIDCCRARLTEELIQSKPLVIICLGASPYYSLFGTKPKKFTDVVGTESEWNGIKVFITNHPAKILHDSAADGKVTRDAIKKAVEKAVKLTTNRQLPLFEFPQDPALSESASYVMLEELKRRCQTWFGSHPAKEKCKLCAVRFYCHGRSVMEWK